MDSVYRLLNDVYLFLFIVCIVSCINTWPPVVLSLQSNSLFASTVLVLHAIVLHTEASECIRISLLTSVY